MARFIKYKKHISIKVFQEMLRSFSEVVPQQ